MPSNPLFDSFFMGGFECSTHLDRAGKRVDVLQSTGHVEHAASDYRQLRSLGIRTVREGLRWYLIEKQPGRYDFSGVLPQVHAAREQGMQVVWDLCHYGWPDHRDIAGPGFVSGLAGLARAFAQLLREETGRPPFICPVNEISFFAWAGGSVAYFNPLWYGRGGDLKQQLVRAAIESIEAVWAVSPQARICHVEPAVHLVPAIDRPREAGTVELYRLAQFEAWDMLNGSIEPQLGGHPKYLDILGVNYYPDNQWVHNGPRLRPGQHRYRPFSSILEEVYSRYRRPVFISETGTEGTARPGWLAYVGEQARVAMQAGVDLHGICLYPVLGHKAWDSDRYCPNGLLDLTSAPGVREVYRPLAEELGRQQLLFGRPPAPEMESRPAQKSVAVG